MADSNGDKDEDSHNLLVAITAVVKRDDQALRLILPNIDVNQEFNLKHKLRQFRNLLSLACYVGHLGIIRLLLAQSTIDVNVEGLRYFHRPLYMAVRYSSNARALGELVKHPSLDVNNIMYLIHTIEFNKKLAFELLLQQTNVSSQLGMGRSQYGDNIIMVAFLSTSTETALEAACRLDRLSMIKALVAFGAPISAKAASHQLLHGIDKLDFDIRARWKLEFTDCNMYWAASNYLTLLAMRSGLINIVNIVNFNDVNVGVNRQDKKLQSAPWQDKLAKTRRFWSLLQSLDDDTAQKLLLVQTGDNRDIIPTIYLSPSYNLSYLPR